MLNFKFIKNLLKESPMKYHHFFIAVSITSILIVGAFFLHSSRPKFETKTHAPSIQYIEASGKCVECHRNETSSIVHQFESSKHIQAGLNCFDCHRAGVKQEKFLHNGFEMAKRVTALNCATCHKTEYDQYMKSRHAAPSWAAVHGKDDFTAEQIKNAELYHPKSINREANRLALLEPNGAISKGCVACHSIGRPNTDGSIGNCTECHSKHNPSAAMARKPETCAQCHMGPDHSQFEIYSESKHGAIYSHLKPQINFNASPKKMTTKDFPVPVCSTCHMSGLEGMNVTHDVSERLSLNLFAPVTTKRINFQRGRDHMKQVCLKCHATSRVEQFYMEGDLVVESTNKVVEESIAIMTELQDKKLITKTPFDEKIEFIAFDLWHYYGRTAKHGAFMGGADFVQWHGNYELLNKMIELKSEAAELKAKKHR